MSWAAHDLEPYALQRHLGDRVAILPLLLGSYAPDALTKQFVYGVDVLGVKVHAHDPAQLHRGWPGFGFTHSLTFGVVLASLIFAVSRSRTWTLSFLIGQWAHVLTDTGDSVGCMLFFPFTTYHVSLGAWAYAAELGRLDDAAAYFSGPGGIVWEGFWVAVCLLSWRVVRRDYFHAVVVPNDGTWRLALRHMPETVVLILFRASFFWGFTRWAGWILWAHFVRDYPIDISWGGPAWAVSGGP